MSPTNPPAPPASFEDLYAEHAPLVLRLMVLFRIPASDCADVAQEVWIDVHRSLPLYDPSRGTARAWLTGIAYNAARDWKRTRRRRPELSALTDEEPPDPSPAQPEESAGLARLRGALGAFLEHAIRDEEQRWALLLHEIEGLTIKEVAQATGVSFWKAQWRIKMARSNVRAAKKRMTEAERDLFRAVLLPFGDVDEILRALREAQPPVSDEEVAALWDRVTESIEAEGGSIHDRLGSATPQPAAPKLYTFTGSALAGALAGMFLLGAVAGAGALRAFLWRDPEASVTTIDAETAPAPLPTAEIPTEPTPTASAAPNVSNAPPSSPWESEAWILDHALKAKPAEALRLADLHALRFPRSVRAAAREEIAIDALLKLGEQAKAEQRAARLVRWAPWMAPRMEELFGRSLL